MKNLQRLVFTFELVQSRRKSHLYPRWFAGVQECFGSKKCDIAYHKKIGNYPIKQNGRPTVDYKPNELITAKQHGSKWDFKLLMSTEK